MQAARNAPLAIGVAAAAIGIAGGLFAAISLQGGANPAPMMAGSVGSVSQQAVVERVNQLAVNQATMNQVAVNLAGVAGTAPRPDEYMLDALPRSYGSAVHAYYAEYMLDIGTQRSRSAVRDC